MTDKAALKEDVKKLVRALLLSTPLGLTVRQVEEDFEAVMGYRLPYQKLGYDSAGELLKNMTDVVKPVWDRGQMKVMGICDDTTRHIQKMVMRQKVDTRKRGGTSRITRPQQPRSYHRMPTYRNTNNSLSNFGKTQNSSTNVSKPRPTKPINKPVVPAHLQFEIKELLISFPNGIHGSNFTTIFQDEYGYLIDYQRLNFGSYLELFKCIPDLEIEMLSSGGYRINDNTQLITPSPVIKNERSEQVNKQDIPTSPSNVGKQEKPKRADNFDDAFIKNIRSILSRNANGFWSNKLPYAYRKLTGIELKLSKYGFFNVIDLVSAMPDVITVERPNPTGDWLLFDARLRISEEKLKQTRSKARPSEPKPETQKITLDELKMRIRKVLEKNPGIVVKQLEGAYEELFGEDLPLQDHGFMDVDTLVVMMPDALTVVYKGRGRLHLYPTTNDSLGRVPEVCKSKVPSDAIGSGVSYKNNDLPPLQEYIEVYVSNVVSPYNLTLQLKGDELLQLEDVMDELEEVYCSNIGDKYKLRESMIAINQVCAALYQQDQNWHRAIITGITNLDFVEVKYVDYGTTASVPKGLLRYLRPSMFRLPIQSYDARLSFIQPVEGKWTKQVQDRILQLCADKPLVALVTNIEGRELSVCLTDTSTDEDIHINDLLVSENLAAFASSTVNVKPYSEYSLVTGYGLDIPTLVYDGNSYNTSEYQEVEPSVTDEVAKPYPLTPPRITLPSLECLSIESPVLATSMYTAAGAEKVAKEEVVGEASTCAVASQDVEELMDEELMEQMNREMGGDLDDLDCSRFIMYLDLGNDRTIHLINHNDIAYVPSANLRTLIDVDAVSQVMQIKQLGIQSVSLSREENPELFAELDEYEVTRGPAGDSQSDSSPYITLYPLERIPSLVAVFEDESSDLSSILTKVFDQFNPLDPYWKGEMSPAENKDESVSDDLDLLKLMLQVSERKRQRILIAMMEDGGNVMVDELTEIEQQIAFIKSKIKAMQIETEEIERGVVGDLASQGHASSVSHHTSTSRHTSVPGDDQDSHLDTAKELTEIVSSPVSVKSEKIMNVGESQKKMNVVGPFKPSVDLANLENTQNTSESFKQPEIYNRTEPLEHKGTTYFNSIPQPQCNSLLNQNPQSYMHHFRPSLHQAPSYGQLSQAVTLQPQTNILQPPPGLPQPPPGLQPSRPNMHVPPIQQTHVQPRMQQNVQLPHMHQNIHQPHMHMMTQQPYIQHPQMHAMQPPYNQPMNNKPNFMHQRFPTGQYYSNAYMGNAYMGPSNPSTSSSFPGQSAANISYGRYWSTKP